MSATCEHNFLVPVSPGSARLGCAACGFTFANEAAWKDWDRMITMGFMPRVRRCVWPREVTA